jgi:hypothetical protein
MIQFIVIKWRKSNKRQVGQFPKENKKIRTISHQTLH